MTASATKTTEVQRFAYQPNEIVGSQGTLKAMVMGSDLTAIVGELAPKHLKPERLLRMVLLAASRQPRLLQCTQSSIIRSAIEATAYGLDCSGLGGRGYLVPFKNGKLSEQQGRDVYEAQFMAGYLGLCDLARRSGEIRHVQGFAVFAGDEFSYSPIDGIKHKPSDDPKQDRTKKGLLYTYALAWYKDGWVAPPTVLNVAQIEAHRKRSKAADSGPWVTDYIPMAIKSAVRELCKWLPQAAELVEVLQKEVELDLDSDRTVNAGELPQPGRHALADLDAAAALDAAVNGQTPPLEPPPAPVAAETDAEAGVNYDNDDLVAMLAAKAGRSSGKARERLDRACGSLFKCDLDGCTDAQRENLRSLIANGDITV